MTNLSAHAVPNLTTTLSGPLLALESKFLANQTQIEAWLRQQWQNTPAPFYASVDLRNAGFKLAPVDTNLFPAGFNNLAPAFYPLCIQALQNALEHRCPSACRILLLPEGHTRNTYYMENVFRLSTLIAQAGYEIRVGYLAEETASTQTLHLPSGNQLTLEPVQKKGQRIGLTDFDPCLVLLNNDLSGGIPKTLDDIEQAIIPPLSLGWQSRLKSDHFSCYGEVAREFAALIDIDPWLVDPLFRNCGSVDFKKREGEDCLYKNVDRLLEDIQAKYDEYDIQKKPFVIVKADAGTYGMSILSLDSPEAVRQLNRKQRNKLASGKEGKETTQVIIQEGVYTMETWGGEHATAEPVVYMIDHSVVGGFYRVHSGRGVTDNLNAPGMAFEPLAFAESCLTPDKTQSPDAEPNRFYAYGVVARLALVAAARELAAAN